MLEMDQNIRRKGLSWLIVPEVSVCGLSLSLTEHGSPLVAKIGMMKEARIIPLDH